MRARERSEALLLTMADGRGRKAKAARCARALIRRFSPPSPASQEKGWGVGLSGAKAQPGLATEPRSHKKLTGHRILSRSEEHTSEIQSIMRNSYAVFRLKNKKN